MDSQQDFTRALNLAGNIFRGEMSLDEAILVASASNMLPALIESLNVLAEGPTFALAEMEQRVQSGEAELALEGRIPRLELPEEIRERHGESKSNSVEWADASFQELDVRVGHLLELERDLTGQIEFLLAVERNRPSPPNPWLAGIIIMCVGLLICVTLAMFMHSQWSALLTFMLFTGMGAAVSLRDWRKYEEFLEKVQREDQHRKVKIDQCQKDLTNAKQEAGAIMQEAAKIITRLEATGPENVHHALATYPRLFWTSGNGPAVSHTE